MSENAKVPPSSGEHAKLQRLKALEEAASMGGGADAIAAQHSKRKLTARERLSLLLDPHSLMEVGKFTKGSLGLHGDGVVTGFGVIDGKQVGVFAQDATVKGGSIGLAHAEKICHIQETCIRDGLPIIGLFDGGGARIQEGTGALYGVSKIFANNVRASGLIPQISAIMGSCAGGAAYSPALTDFTFMVRDTSFMYLTGPDVVSRALHEEVTHEELGGAQVHAQKSGVAQFTATNELECIQKVRQLLSYLPNNCWSDLPRHPAVDSPMGSEDKLLEVVPSDQTKSYDVRRVIELVMDPGTFLEVHSLYAPNLVVGLARLSGKVVGIVANQPQSYAGVLDIFSSKKGARFVQFCDSFNIPIVTFEDTGGFLPGKDQEHDGVITFGAQLLYAYCVASVPLLTVVLRKAYGGAYCVLGSKGIGADYTASWPDGEIAVLGPAMGVPILYGRELKAITSKTKQKRVLDQRIAEYAEEFLDPLKTAEKGYIDEVIDPRATRSKLIRGLEMFGNKAKQPAPKKHGNMPL